ncbi:MAG: hypothetical protein JSR71_08455 [Proteobacteria bacterium]|nr:hypothetical protein [Pseudomonadota bacterium]
MSRFRSLTFILLLCLSIPQAGWAALWLETYDGKPEDFRLVRRDGKEFAVMKQIVLQPGDKISVLNPDGKLFLKDDLDHNSLTITKQEGIYEVPSSPLRPNYWDNVYALLREKISDLLDYKTTTVSVSIRTEVLPILIVGASGSKTGNQLLEGSETLTVYWIDGKPPYRVRLFDKDKRIIAEKNGLRETHMTFTGIYLPVGEYTFEVSDEILSHSIQLRVVDLVEAPPLYHTIMASDMPDVFKQRYAAATLASKREWLLQALQLAKRADWHSFIKRILDGKTPEPIDE